MSESVSGEAITNKPENAMEIKTAAVGADLNKRQKISSPIKGNVVELSKVSDPAFGQEVMGKEIAIEPTEGRAVSPINGKVATVFQTKHAIG